jgi:primosomal replication protein N
MMKQADSATLEKKIAHIQDIIDRGKGATVEVSYSIFPGTTVSIDGFINILRSKQKSVRFELDEAGEHVVMISRNGSYLR